MFLLVYCLADSPIIDSTYFLFFQCRLLCSQSHQAGPGPQFQRVLFNLHGKSPLIAHFFSANRIQVDEPAALKKLVTRTELEKYPYPLQITMTALTNGYKPFIAVDWMDASAVE